MSEVVVIPDSEPEEGTAVAFAAGVATAEAAQASEEAAEALEVAEAAAATAETAVEIAIEASAAGVAGVSYEDLEALRAEVRGELEELRGMVADAVIEGGAEEGPLTPERVEREEGPAPEEHDGQEEKTESKSAGRYGNPRWFNR